ncbi:hypothetical protein MKX01_023966 [Papaver californicum]|nr:hypothetical protein MKX01_023966 [Papaver californicum]
MNICNICIAGEKPKEEEVIELDGSLGKSNAVSNELVSREGRKACKDLARTVLVESVNSYPWNWSAWTELQCLCTTNDILKNLDLKNHWMKGFFLGRYSSLTYQPESCCIIGNYYILKGEHEKFVMYFRRAFKRAMDINPCVIVPGMLGQAYEIMRMPFYALYYFRKSVYLQPSDSRLWIATAQCYETEQLHMLEEAIKCYERAANCNDREAISLHQELGRSEKAPFYYEDLERMEAEEMDGPNMVEALLFLVTHCTAVKRFRETEIGSWIIPEKETTKSLLQGIKYLLLKNVIPPRSLL